MQRRKATMTFYDEFAAEYDDITAHDRRAVAAAEFVRQFTGRYVVRLAVDVACGTGLYAVALAKAGAETVGVDVSAKMLQQARAGAEEAGVSVRWIESLMQNLAGRLSAKHDAVVCMGNSLPHLLRDDDLDAALSAFRSVLSPGGVLAIHILNYERILAEGERVVGVSRRGDRQYVRFYDFLEGLVRFNVLRIEWCGEQCSHSLHGTILRPYERDELRDALGRHGFGDVAAYGDLRFSEFDRAGSDSLLMLATT